MADEHWHPQADIGPSEKPITRFTPVQQYVSLFFARQLFLLIVMDEVCLSPSISSFEILSRVISVPFEISAVPLAGIIAGISEENSLQEGLVISPSNSVSVVIVLESPIRSILISPESCRGVHWPARRSRAWARSLVLASQAYADQGRHGAS